MQTFHDYIKLREQDDVSMANVASQAVQPVVQAPTSPAAQGKWKANKKEIINYWKALSPNSPILMTPISYDHKGSTYKEDGVRINGSPQFIASVLGRLKEMLAFESPATKLNLVYREAPSSHRFSVNKLPTAPTQTKKSYVCYIASRQRHR